MKVFVGLGNPGKEYSKTRHNIGADFIDYFANKKNLQFTTKFRSLYCDFNNSGEKIIFLKPQTFMNESGDAVLEIMKFFKLESEDLYIIFDDLDLIEGKLKVQKGHYPKSHNGINDIIKKIGNDNFNYIRIGIESRTDEEKKNFLSRDFVLSRYKFDYIPIFEEIINRLNLEIDSNIANYC